jgi:methylenetetrahydrofolate reductase (NADPH)
MAALLENFSLEITSKDVEQVDSLAALVPPGTMVSVTFLPGESFASRVEAAARLQAVGLRPVPHISARRLTSAAELEEFLAALAANIRLQQVFVVAGDLSEPAGPYVDALAVIRSGLLERYGVRHVGVAGYPEGHPQIATERLAAALLDKQRECEQRGLEWSVMTQFGFDARPTLDWLAALRRDGVDVPVRIGVAGPASLKTLVRFAARCGVGLSASVMKKYGWSLSNLLGGAGPDGLLQELAGALTPAVHGTTHLHFYPFGGLEKTGRWVKDFAARQRTANWDR